MGIVSPAEGDAIVLEGDPPAYCELGLQGSGRKFPTAGIGNRLEPSTPSKRQKRPSLHGWSGSAQRWKRPPGERFATRAVLKKQNSRICCGRTCGCPDFAVSALCRQSDVSGRGGATNSPRQQMAEQAGLSRDQPVFPFSLPTQCRHSR
jgi:hypothetical protein